jgi:hypothetical protein
VDYAHHSAQADLERHFVIAGESATAVDAQADGRALAEGRWFGTAEHALGVRTAVGAIILRMAAPRVEGWLVTAEVHAAPSDVAVQAHRLPITVTDLELVLLAYTLVLERDATTPGEVGVEGIPGAAARA